MKTAFLVGRAGCWLACALAVGWIPELWATPRQPLPPLPEFVLARWTWDEALRQYPFGQAPAEIPEADLVESWSGYALRRAGAFGIPFAIPKVDDNGRTNFTSEVGTIRFWFKPDWASASLGGTGPGNHGRWLEMHDVGSTSSTVDWALYVSPDGATIYASGQGAWGPVDLLTAPIAWTNGQWHLVALTYTPTSTRLWLDGQMAAEGPAFLDGARPTGGGRRVLVIGSDGTGHNLAQGQFEELTTFRRACQASELDWCWQSGSRRAARGPITAEEEAAVMAQRSAALAAREAEQAIGNLAQSGSLRSANSFGPQPLSADPVDCGTGGPPYLTNCSTEVVDETTWLFKFTIAGGVSGELYDIFCATNLVRTFEPYTDWTWSGQGSACQEITLTNPPLPNAFFILGTSYTSNPSGFTDAYFNLVLAGQPTYLYLDNNSNNLWDAWEISHGLGPSPSDPNDDPDRDGLTTGQEYQFGSHPRVPAGFQVWVGVPGSGGNLP